jgi:hypothetical protein
VVAQIFRKKLNIKTEKSGTEEKSRKLSLIICKKHCRCTALQNLKIYIIKKSQGYIKIKGVTTPKIG